MKINKLKKMLKEHFFNEDSDNRKRTEQWELFEDAIDECLEQGGDVHVRYTVNGPEVQMTYVKKAAPQY